MIKRELLNQPGYAVVVLCLGGLIFFLSAIGMTHLSLKSQGYVMVHKSELNKEYQIAITDTEMTTLINDVGVIKKWLKGD